MIPTTTILYKRGIKTPTTTTETGLRSTRAKQQEKKRTCTSVIGVLEVRFLVSSDVLEGASFVR
jgi:hypothetical protein